ncbi:MAG: sigma 54-dependent Fis family transcriptional regulator [Myxococcales bacterium]|nr:sigma 54-dependent Fis family transcriptional regulator [Myxococcales bacterium]
MGKTDDLATTRRPRFERPEQSGVFVLAVVEGPDAGKVFTIDASAPSRALVGKSPVCAMRLDDREVSRRHAALAVAGRALQIVDLGSTNGTTVNGVSIKEAFLHGGEAIRVGASVLSVQREQPRFVPLTEATAFGRLVGESPAMRKLYPVLKQLSQADTAVLLEGESGTGKELAAEELHMAGPRKDAPFLTLESSTLDEAAQRRELLGGPGQPGLLQRAAGGTLFVDEIGNVPAELQALLAGVAERREKPLVHDVRLIAATRRDLDRDVGLGRFDDGLFFALVAGRIEMPPLRERAGDVSALARAFWADLRSDDGAAKGDAPAALPEDFLPRFEGYTWPGNVRELKAAVLVRFTQGELGALHRSEPPPTAGDLVGAILDEKLPFPRARERVVQEFERRYVERALAEHGGNVTKAAVASGIAHRYFQLIRARNR